MTKQQAAEKYAQDHCLSCNDSRFYTPCECSALEAGFIAGYEHKEKEVGMRWVRASDRLPDRQGYYIAESEWVRPGIQLPLDRSDTYFDGEKWDHSDDWSVIRWLDESAPPDTGLRQALEKIANMKREPGETNDNYAFNRCWHIATQALNQNKQS